MNLEKQKLCLTYMLSNNDLATRINSILDPNYFDPQIRHAAHFAQTYLDKYKHVPNAEQVLAETGVDVKTREMTKHEVEFATTELEQFCKESAIEKAILASPKLLEQGDYGKIEKLIKDAITIGLNKNLGLDYFYDPEERLKRMLLNNVMIPTKWLELDTALNGGLMRKEMTLLSANSGVGKSILMMNLAINFIEQGLNVCYISLELSEDVVAKRFDSMMTGIAQTEIFKNIQKVTNIVQQQKDQSGGLFIKRLPESTTNANHIRAYLKEFESLHGFVPDILVVDYLDIMTSNNKISAENLFVKDKYIAEELRSIANDYNLIMITASQQNRGAINSSSNDLSQGAIAGGISKVNTTDNLISIIQSDQMKAAGEYMLKLLKTRSSGGVGSVIALGWDPISLRVTNLNEKQTKRIFRDRRDVLLETATDDEKKDDAKRKSPGKGILEMMQV